MVYLLVCTLSGHSKVMGSTVPLVGLQVSSTSRIFETQLHIMDVNQSPAFSILQRGTAQKMHAERPPRDSRMPKNRLFPAVLISQKASGPLFWGPSKGDQFHAFY